MAAPAAKASLGIADILHRTLVSGLFGLSLYGGFGMYQMHMHRLALGVEALAKHDAEELAKANGTWVEPPTDPSTVPAKI